MVDNILHELERQSREKNRRVREMLLAKGRFDLVERFDEDMKAINNGTRAAWSTWHSISDAQRRALEYAGNRKFFARHPGQKSFYDAYGPPHMATKVCRLSTARNLIARDLLACEGGVHDPEAKLVITDHGRFVLKHGPDGAGKGYRP